MKTVYRIFRTDRPAETGEIEWPDDPGYEAIRTLVVPLLGGAAMEHVSVLYQDQPADMFVDEVGALRCLCVNSVATNIYRANWLKHHPDTAPETLPYIYGTAVLFERRVWF